MSVIYDNIEQHLIDTLRVTLQDAKSVDCCVGYFNLRGWRRLAEVLDLDSVRRRSPTKARVLVGMHRGPE